MIVRVPLYIAPSEPRYQRHRFATQLVCMAPLLLR